MPQHSRLFASRDQSAPRPQTQAARPTEPGRRLSPSLGAALALAACLVAANLLSPQMRAQNPAAGQQRTALRHQQAVPQLQGSDGTQTGTADFLGNFTTISTPIGRALGFSPCRLLAIPGDRNLHHRTDLRLHCKPSSPQIMSSSCIRRRSLPPLQTSLPIAVQCSRFPASARSRASSSAQPPPESTYSPVSA